MPGTFERIGDMRCGVGESPVWHAGEAALYWTDIPNRTLWRFDPASGRTDHWAVPEMAGCMAMTADGGWLLADRKSTRLNSSHTDISRMPSSA